MGNRVQCAPFNVILELCKPGYNFWIAGNYFKYLLNYEPKHFREERRQEAGECFRLGRSDFNRSFEHIVADNLLRLQAFVLPVEFIEPHGKRSRSTCNMGRYLFHESIRNWCVRLVFLPYKIQLRFKFREQRSEYKTAF